MAEDNDHDQSAEHLEEEDAISLLDLLLVFVRHKKKILIIPFLVGCAMAVYSLQVPEIFTAQTTLIPSDQKQSGTMAMLSQLGPMAGLLGAGGGSGSGAEVLVTMVKRRRWWNPSVPASSIASKYWRPNPLKLTGIRA